MVERTTRRAQGSLGKSCRFIEAFKERWEEATCRELKGLDVKETEGIKEYLRAPHHAFTEPVKFAVRKAIKILTNKFPFLFYKE